MWSADQACIDLVYSAEDGASLVKRIESRNGLHTLAQAEKSGSAAGRISWFPLTNKGKAAAYAGCADGSNGKFGYMK